VEAKSGRETKVATYFECAKRKVWFKSTRTVLTDGESQQPLKSTDQEADCLDCILRKIELAPLGNATKKSDSSNFKQLWVVCADSKECGIQLIVEKGEKFLQRNIAATLQNNGCHVSDQSSSFLKILSESLSLQGAKSSQKLFVLPSERGFNSELGIFVCEDGICYQGNWIGFDNSGFAKLADGNFVCLEDRLEVGKLRRVGQMYVPLRMEALQTSLPPSQAVLNWAAAMEHFAKEAPVLVGLCVALAIFPRCELLARKEEAMLPFPFVTGPKGAGKTELLKQLSYCTSMTPLEMLENRDPVTIPAFRDLLASNRTAVSVSEVHQGGGQVSLGNKDFEKIIRQMFSGSSLANHDRSYVPVGFPIFDGIDPRGIASDRFFFAKVYWKPLGSDAGKARTSAMEHFEEVRKLVLHSMVECCSNPGSWNTKKYQIFDLEKTRIREQYGLVGRSLWVAYVSTALRIIFSDSETLAFFESWLEVYVKDSQNRALVRMIEFGTLILRFIHSGDSDEVIRMQGGLHSDSDELFVSYSELFAFLRDRSANALGFALSDLFEELEIGLENSADSEVSYSAKYSWVRRCRAPKTHLGRKRLLRFSLRDTSIPCSLRELLIELAEFARLSNLPCKGIVHE
jgi:hypothetical protein